jgi:hypothetical protein
VHERTAAQPTRKIEQGERTPRLSKRRPEEIGKVERRPDQLGEVELRPHELGEVEPPRDELGDGEAPPEELGELEPRPDERGKVELRTRATTVSHPDTARRTRRTERP